MPKRIEFEGKIHEFPDDFTDAEISAALSPASVHPDNPPANPGQKGARASTSLMGPPASAPTYGSRMGESATRALMGPTGGGPMETFNEGRKVAINSQPPFIHPIDTAIALRDTAKGLITLNPETVGATLAMLPFNAYGGQLSRTLGPVVKAGVEGGIKAIPEVPGWAATGATLGEGVSYSTGHGHVGAIPGAVAGASVPLIRGAARGVSRSLSEQMPVPVHPTPATAPAIPIPPSRQLGPASVITTEVPADTSGVIKGWQPTILEREPVAPSGPQPESPHIPIQQPRFDPMNLANEAERALVNRRAQPYGNVQNPAMHAAPIQPPSDFDTALRGLAERTRARNPQMWDESIGEPEVHGPQTRILETIPETSPLSKNPKALKVAQKLANLHR